VFVDGVGGAAPQAHAHPIDGRPVAFEQQLVGGAKDIRLADPR